MANEFYLKGYDSISVTNVRNNLNDECGKSLVVIIVFLTSYFFFENGAICKYVPLE